MSESGRRACAVAALGLAAILPLFVSAGGIALYNLVLAAAYVVMALGLNIVVGFAGLLDLGYVAFFAIGAHAAAHFGSAFWGIHLNFLIIFVIAAALATIAGVLIGVPTLRLRGDYIAVVTLAFGEIIGQVVANGRQIEFLGGSLTGGPNGMSAVDRIDLPFLERFGVLELRPWYGVGAALGGVSGAFLASYSSFVNPGQFTFSFSIFILAMVVLGGLGSIWGVVVGAVLLSAINNYLLPRVLYDLPGKVGLEFDLTEITSGIYGLLLVLLMLLRPLGILPERALAAASG